LLSVPKPQRQDLSWQNAAALYEDILIEAKYQH